MKCKSKGLKKFGLLTVLSDVGSLQYVHSMKVSLRPASAVSNVIGPSRAFEGRFMVDRFPFRRPGFLDRQITSFPPPLAVVTGPAINPDK